MRVLNVILIALVSFSSASYAAETDHFMVVKEFIKEIGEMQNLRETAMADIAETSKYDGAEQGQRTMTDAIRNGTRAKQKLRLNVYSLKRMKLDKPFDTVIPYLVKFNEVKIDLYDELIKTAKVLVGAVPQKGVDLNKLVSRMPEITAEMEYADESFFKVTPMIFALLIDKKPDSQNHMSRLIITKEQGDELVTSLNNWFGESLNEKKQNWSVSSGAVMKTYLTEKGFNYSDDLN